MEYVICQIPTLIFAVLFFYARFSNTYTEVLIRQKDLIVGGSLYRSVLTIRRSYKNGKIKIIHKKITY